MLNKNQIFLIIILLSCIGSRILTSIYYIEDIDSLRFALSIYEYDLIKLQPHFPGYPVFSFIVKCLYLITGNMGVSFSIIGGISVFSIIYFLLRISNLIPLSKLGLFLIFIIFFNPLVWLMSNRYMPDLFGLSIFISALYLFISDIKDRRFLYIGYFLTGLLAGVRLSYLPLLAIPFLMGLKRHKNIKYSIFSFLTGCLIWLIPLILITGLDDIWTIGYNHTVGHFMDYGGTAFTNNDWSFRIIRFIQSVWSDGLGGYWLERSWQTFILSIFIILIFIQSLRVLFINKLIDKNFKIIIGCVLVYSIWIFFSQNIIYKSRHILPILIPFFIIFPLSLKPLSRKLYPYVQIGVLLFCLFLFNISITLIGQHKNPSAIAQLKNDLEQQESIKTVISTPLINYYLKSNGIKKKFINIDKSDELELFKYQNNNEEILLIGNFKPMFKDNYTIIEDNIFYHNPYVNRMWSQIETYKIINEYRGEN